MREAFEKFINEGHLFEEDDKLLVAVSGGSDSVALCHLLHSIKANFNIAHCNFQLRGEESDGDARFVEQLAGDLGVPVFIRNFDTEKIVKESNLSIQMAARKLRYEWFEELRMKTKSNYLATAHHKNDSLETILLNLTRGTGLAGLHGIKAKNGYVIRPLSFATKADILGYLEENNIPFREDSSNSINKYYRNLIRNRVIPELKKINPNLEETISTFIERIESTEEIIENEVAKFTNRKKTETNERIYIDLKDLNQEPGLLIKLSSVLEKYNFSFSQCKSLLKVLNSQSGKVFFSSTHKLVKDRDSLIITQQKQEPDIHYSIDADVKELHTPDFTLLFNVVEKDRFEMVADKTIGQFDYEKVKFPIIVRRWAEGDFFYPLGMKKKKKLSDFFIDNKIPVPDKERILILVSEENIIWIAGQRIDERYKITAATTKILNIRLKR